MSQHAGSEEATPHHDPKSYGNGYTAGVDEDGYQGSAFVDAIGRIAEGGVLRMRFLQAQAEEIALRRDEVGRAYLRAHNWYSHQWAHTRLFASVWILAMLAAIYAMVTHDQVAVWIACCLFLPCMGRAIQVLSLPGPGLAPVTVVVPEDIVGKSAAPPEPEAVVVPADA